MRDRQTSGAMSRGARALDLVRRIAPCFAALAIVTACAAEGSAPAPRDGGSDDASEARDANAPGDASAPAPSQLRVRDRAALAWLGARGAERWWLEERLAPQPMREGDRDPGQRAIVRGAPDREVVWSAPPQERLTDACLHPSSGHWSAVGVDDDRRVFVARGDAHGLLERVLLEDPELASDDRAWLDTPRTQPRVGALTEASPVIGADGEDVVIALTTEDFALLVYRLSWEAGGYAAEARALVSPAAVVTPFLPIGGSYDDFDAVVAPYLPRLAVDAAGRAFVAMVADRSRVARHNAVLGTSLDLVRESLSPREGTLDFLLSRVDRDGTVAFTRVVGTPDYEDELFAITVGSSRVALLGRRRRELGRDNTELHAVVVEVDLDGDGATVTTIDADASAIALAGAYQGEDLWVGGAQGWLQNPSGRSVLQPGRPLLFRLRGPARTLERHDALLPETSGHAELRSVLVTTDGALHLAGLENGPITHTGDADPTRIRSDAWLARTLP